MPPFTGYDPIATVQQAITMLLRTQEPAFIAKFAFQLAQAFNLFYHQHHILSEADPARKIFLLQLSRLAEQQMVAALSVLGIDAPEKM